ncbi:MAG: alpha/beta hydrolase [Firmicutes bacterium]|jgi:fermentation-respiration switch protein FrsA (DUF1100 family)|nr:alpha/beta hydrolase [Bacillota bacterium]
MKIENLKAGINSVDFVSEGYTLAGDMYLPEGFDPDNKYPTILYFKVGTQVKEQVGSVYGKKMSKLGYIFYAFDIRGFGESQGKVRHQENAHFTFPAYTDAISFLSTMPFVDKERLTGLGICAGGAYVSYTALVDKRLKAIATVSGYLNHTDAFFGMMTREQAVGALNYINSEQQRYYESGECDTADVLGFCPRPPADDAPNFVKGTYDYYLTPRGGYGNYTNMLASTSFTVYPGLNVKNIAHYLYTPILCIAGSEADTKPMTDEVFEAATEPKELFIIDGATHFDLYDIDRYVDQAVERIDAFYKKHC